LETPWALVIIVVVTVLALLIMKR